MFEKVKDAVMGLFGSGNEFFDSTGEVLKERITSPFWGYFIVSSVVLNWELIYIALLADHDILFEKTGLLRNEYVAASLPQGADALLYFVLYPVLLSVVLSWLVPPILTRPFFKRFVINQQQLEIIRLQTLAAKKSEEKNLVEQEKNLIQEKTKLALEEQKAEKEAPEIVWEKEFKNFTESLIFSRFNQVIDSLYVQSGRISYVNNNGIRRTIDTDILVYLDSNGLVNIDRSSNQISLTEKGKFFLRRYSEIKNQAI